MLFRSRSARAYERGGALLHAPNQKQAWPHLASWIHANCKNVSLNLGT